MRDGREFAGEALGTFILVLFGCGAVAAGVLFDAHRGLAQVALAWGVGVSLAIYATRHLSCAHLNPAVSLAMVIGGRMPLGKMPLYLAAQFFGATLAALTLYGLFSPSISAFEGAHGILRGTPESVRSAMLFGEYYPNPGFAAVVSLPLAMGAEALGTFLLVLMVLALTEDCNVGRPDGTIAPLAIGLTVTSVICLIAPLTQAGLNPARDLGPRLVAWLAGWGDAAFPDRVGGFLHVYVLSPLLGSALASIFFFGALGPLMRDRAAGCGCDGGSS